MTLGIDTAPWHKGNTYNLKHGQHSHPLYAVWYTRDQKWEVTYKFRFKTKEEAEEFARKHNPWRANL